MSPASGELLKHSGVVPGSDVSVKPGEDVLQEWHLLNSYWQSKSILGRRDTGLSDIDSTESCCENVTTDALAITKSGTTIVPTTSENGTTTKPTTMESHTTIGPNGTTIEPTAENGTTNVPTTKYSPQTSNSTESATAVPNTFPPVLVRNSYNSSMIVKKSKPPHVAKQWQPITLAIITYKFFIHEP